MPAVFSDTGSTSRANASLVWTPKGDTWWMRGRPRFALPPPCPPVGLCFSLTPHSFSSHRLSCHAFLNLFLKFIYFGEGGEFRGGPCALFFLHVHPYSVAWANAVSHTHTPLSSFNYWLHYQLYIFLENGAEGGRAGQNQTGVGGSLSLITWLWWMNLIYFLYRHRRPLLNRCLLQRVMVIFSYYY